MLFSLAYVVGASVVNAIIWFKYLVVQTVQHEAARVDRQLAVSDAMLLSSPQLQDEFYEWMDKSPEVRMLPWISFAVALGMSLKILRRDGCGWHHFLSVLPCLILAGGRLALEAKGASKQAQSMASTLLPVYVNAIMISFLTMGDTTCFGSLGPSLESSPIAAAVYAAVTLLHYHAGIPCTVGHLLALCCVTAPGSVISVYLQYLHQNGGIWLEADPNGIAFFAIAVSTLACLYLAAVLRLHYSQKFMVAFLRTKRP